MVQSPSWEANWFVASQKNSPHFTEPRRFITALTSVRQLSLSWASPIQSIYTHPTSCRSILILSTHLRLGLPIGLFPYGFPTKTLYTPFSSPIRATCPAHLILPDFITGTILGEEYLQNWEIEFNWVKTHARIYANVSQIEWRRRLLKTTTSHAAG
jgi:hypothetical protein